MKAFQRAEQKEQQSSALDLNWAQMRDKYNKTEKEKQLEETNCKTASHKGDGGRVSRQVAF